MDNSDQNGTETANEGQADNPPPSSSAVKLVLRPSSLAAQAEKLKCSNPREETNKATNEESSSSSNKVNEVSKTTVPEGVKPESVQQQGSSFSELASTSLQGTASNNSFGLFSACSQKDSSSSGGFVFGQNLHERAANYSAPEPENLFAAAASSELTFESVQKEETKTDSKPILKRSLSDEAKEYEAKKIKTVYEEVNVTTGEEDERNVLQINCKLFSFDKDKKIWQGKGRGLLRLNDQEVEDGAMHSRVIMRTQGSLRVVLNTKVWSGMTVERPNEKSVQLTAFDPEGIKVYLIMSSLKDSDNLFRALQCRISSLKSNECRPSKNDNGNDFSVDESVSLSSTINTSSNDSIQDFPKKPSGDFHPDVEASDNASDVITSVPETQPVIAQDSSNNPTPL